MNCRAGWYHKSCLKCSVCSHGLDATNFNDGPDGRIYCKGCYKANNIMDSNLIARSVADTTSIQGYQGDKESCPKCSGKVFEAEKMVMRSGNYHKKCFTCAACSRALDHFGAVDSPQGIQCQTCYAKSYGPSELRVLTDTDGIKSVDTTVIKPVGN